MSIPYDSDTSEENNDNHESAIIRPYKRVRDFAWELTSVVQKPSRSHTAAMVRQLAVALQTPPEHLGTAEYSFEELNKALRNMWTTYNKTKVRQSKWLLRTVFKERAPVLSKMIGNFKIVQHSKPERKISANLSIPKTVVQIQKEKPLLYNWFSELLQHCQNSGSSTSGPALKVKLQVVYYVFFEQLVEGKQVGCVEGDITYMLQTCPLQQLRDAYRSFLCNRPSVQRPTINRHVFWLNSVLTTFVKRPVLHDENHEQPTRRKTVEPFLGPACEYYTNSNERTNTADTSDDEIQEEQRRHRFSMTEVAQLFSACTTTKESLVFALLFTTGMRLGGLVRIKIHNVACRQEELWDIFSTGHTVEKGRKRKQFTIQPVVKSYLLRWLTDERPSSLSKYLFPSHIAEQGHVSRSSMQTLFARVATNAGVVGPHVHVHTTRHTVAFELFEAGNRLEHVAKFLGHSPAVCEKFYLKFCHADVMARINSRFLCSVGTDAQKSSTTTPKEVERTPTTRTEIPTSNPTQALQIFKNQETKPPRVELETDDRKKRKRKLAALVHVMEHYRNTEMPRGDGEKKHRKC